MHRHVLVVHSLRKPKSSGRPPFPDPDLQILGKKRGNRVPRFAALARPPS